MERGVRSNPIGPASRRLSTSVAGALAVVLALVAWLWPIGIGGKMPVGGDVTQFFIGLMGFLSESLRQGRLPVWNDLWGYGFPGVAESQMGVFYPFHVILYRWLENETAYVVSLVGHTLWGGLGTYWAAPTVECLMRRCGAGCGFMVYVRVFPYSPGSSLGLHDRLLDALGVGLGLVQPLADKRITKNRADFAELGAGFPDITGTFSACVPNAVWNSRDRGLDAHRALGAPCREPRHRHRAIPLLRTCAG